MQRRSQRLMEKNDIPNYEEEDVYDMPSLEITKKRKIEDSQQDIRKYFLSDVTNVTNPINDDEYGSVCAVKPPRNMRKRSVRSGFFEDSTQYRKSDCQNLCKNCESGETAKKMKEIESIREKIEAELYKQKLSISLITGGKNKIGQDFLEKYEECKKKLSLKKVQVKAVHQITRQIKRTTKPIPELLPIQNECNNNCLEIDYNNNFSNMNDNNTDQCVPSISYEINVLQSYTEIYSTNDDNALDFTKDQQYLERFRQGFQSNFIVNHKNSYDVMMNMQQNDENSSDSWTSNLVIDEGSAEEEICEDENVKVEDAEEENIVETKETDKYVIVVQKNEENEDKDFFAIDDDDKKHIEDEPCQNKTTINPPNRTPIPNGDDEQDEDALQICVEDDFPEEVCEEKHPPKKKPFEQKSIITAFDDDPTRSNKNRFNKNKRGRKRQMSPMVNDRNKFPKLNQSVSWNRAAFQDSKISPFKTQLFPQTKNLNPYTKLCDEISRICPVAIQGECYGGINCNKNHSFPDPDHVCEILFSMDPADIKRFADNCYSRIPLALRYFPAIAKYYGTKQFKNQLVDAIPRAESNDFLLTNYKWIIHGLILAGTSAPAAIQMLLDNQKNHTPMAYKVIMEIILKTNTEIQFLDNLIEISVRFAEVFSVQHTNKLIQVAIWNPNYLSKWDTLIDNIIEKHPNFVQVQSHEHIDLKLAQQFYDLLTNMRQNYYN